MFNIQNWYTISPMFQLSWYILRSFKKSFYFFNKDIQIRIVYQTILVGAFHRHIDLMTVTMGLAHWHVVVQDGCNEVIMLHVVSTPSLYYEISLLNLGTFYIVPDGSIGNWLQDFKEAGLKWKIFKKKEFYFIVTSNKSMKISTIIYITDNWRRQNLVKARFWNIYACQLI